MTLTCYAEDKATEKAVITEESSQDIISYRLNKLERQFNELKEQNFIYTQKINALENELKVAKEINKKLLEDSDTYEFKKQFLDIHTNLHDELLAESSNYIGNLQIIIASISIIVAAALVWYTISRNQIINDLSTKAEKKVVNNKTFLIKLAENNELIEKLAKNNELIEKLSNENVLVKNLSKVLSLDPELADKIATALLDDNSDNDFSDIIDDMIWTCIETHRNDCDGYREKPNFWD